MSTKILPVLGSFFGSRTTVTPLVTTAGFAGWATLRPLALLPPRSGFASPSSARASLAMSPLSTRVTMPSKIAESLRPFVVRRLRARRSAASSALPVRCPDGPRKPWRASRSSSPRSSDWRAPAPAVRASMVVSTVVPSSNAARSPYFSARKRADPVDRLAGHAARRRRSRAPGGSARRPAWSATPAVDEAVLGHLPEHVALPRLRRLGVLARRQPLRALRQARPAAPPRRG